jgi:hypothetical protein
MVARKRTLRNERRTHASVRSEIVRAGETVHVGAQLKRRRLSERPPLALSAVASEWPDGPISRERVRQIECNAKPSQVVQTRYRAALAAAIKRRRARRDAIRKVVSRIRSDFRNRKIEIGG